MADAGNGFNGHQFWTVAEYYPMVQNLSAPTREELISAIQDSLATYDAQEEAEWNSLLRCMEYRAYQISDTIDPRYFYQNCGQYSADDCP